MSRKLLVGSLMGFACAVAACPGIAAPDEKIPNFSPDSTTGWLKPPGDEFIQPAAGQVRSVRPISHQRAVRAGDAEDRRSLQPHPAALGEGADAQRERSGARGQGRLHRALALLAAWRAGLPALSG